ncbi:MAG: hypothetical protein KatS3mg125_1014 [Lysobacterales bacterium]|nr:MAG: hypothetical protein KatS3mg125_1014 [Xanthomonadales bacterium]
MQAVATDALHELRMDLADQAHRDGKIGQPCQAMVHGPHVVGYLLHVLGGVGVEKLRLGGEQVLQRALCALDLAGEHRLLAHVHVDEEIRIGQREHRAIEPAQRVVGGGEPLAQGAAEIERRVGRAATAPG